MSYQIDQSGKIEQMNKATILCLSNSYWDAVKIQARTKRQIQEIFRRNGQIRNFILFTFSASLAFLIKRNPKVKRVIIDQEYLGKEAVIKALLLKILVHEKRVPQISFANIGKHSPAHLIAKEIFLGKKRASAILGERELLRKIKKTEVGKRLKDA